MQVKTYIYGTPFGFNFYEDDSQYKDYFKSFYISSRTGRRLMVNRLDNGETTYNYLCYGITECKSRPNAFFGMSFVMSDHLYCANFSKLYEWFDFLFEKLINEHHLITQTENGLQYQVEKFDDNPTDTEWLKANIPNILSAPDIRLERYDSNFSNRRTGIIAQFNTSEQPDKVIQSFRKNRWISLSPTFKSDKDFPELDWMELSALLNVVTKQLLPIAINPEAEHLPILKSINSEMKDNYKSISEYVEKVSDNELKDRFVELRAKYYEVLNRQLPQIAQKINSSNIQQDGSESKSSHGKPPTPPVTYRICQKCGRQMPIEAFENNDSICIECRNKEKGGFTLPKNMFYAGISALTLVILVVCVVVFKPFAKSGDNGNGGEDKSPIEKLAPNSATTVDESRFNQLIIAGNFEAALDYITGKDDEAARKTQLKTAYENYLLKQKPDVILREMINRYDFCMSVGVDCDEWNNFANAANTISEYLSKSSLTNLEKQYCQNIINKYNQEIFRTKHDDWQRRLSSISTTIDIPASSSDTAFLYNKKGEVIQKYAYDTYKNENGCFSVREFPVGGYVIVSCKNEPQTVNGYSPNTDITIFQKTNNQYKIKPNKIGKWVIRWNDIQMTITATPQYSKK